MNKFYIICPSYKPNTAPINRLLSFLAAFDEVNLQIEMIFIYPDENFSKLHIGYNSVTINYLWEGTHTRNKYLRYIKSFLDVIKFSKKLRKGDKVFCFGCSQYLPIIVKSPAWVYHERTEHPNIVPTVPFFLQKKYLKACVKLRGMFVITTALKKYFEDLGVKNVTIVNMTVDSSRFKFIKKQEIDYPYIAYCGTASNNKDGVNNLIKAFAIVHGRHPEFKLIIIGKAPSQGEDFENLTLVKKLGLLDSVVFTGVISASDMPQKLKNADIVALARPDSLQARCGFPTKLGEYLLTGNPVVATSVGDIPLFLKDKESALLSVPNDIEGFAANLLWAIEHKEEASQIGKNGYKIANSEFNNKIEAKKIIDAMV